ncbi:hypothetical protein N0V86_007036 [Didymella sp. IMI 355093]|nr:hypothetical protein N0V86_007036 [Didymella sp. IMI 355093]
MSPASSRAAIRFVVALFLAQTFVNAVAVPHPHIHKVLDPRQVVSLPVVERQEPAEPESTNVFDALINTLKGYNGWQVFQDFFRKLFSGTPPPAENNGPAPSVSVSLAPVPVASESSIDVVSVIASIISDAASVTEPVVIVPTSTEPETSTTDEVMSILPIFPITTAIDLSGALETVVPTEFLSSELSETSAVPEVTAPVVVVVPDVNSTAVVVIAPTDVVAPIVTAPIVTGPLSAVAPIATDAPFPIENGTLVAPVPGTDVPVVVVLPTGILPSNLSSPIEANVSASAVVNATVSLTSTIGITLTAVAPIGTDLPSVGTGLPITISEVGAPFANATAITPTLILVTGTGNAVGTIAPTISVEPIGAPFANSSDVATAVAPIGIILSTGTGIVGTGVVGTGIVGTGEATAVLPIDTAIPFPNTTAVEIVIQPTLVLPSGTAPVGTISAAPIASDLADAIYSNTTTTTVTNIITPILSTGIETAVAPIGTDLPGTIVIVPGPGSTDNSYFPNITITANATADATLSVEVPVATALPVETTLPELPLNITLAPIAPVGTGFPASPIETVAPIINETIPSDAPVVEFPGEPTPVPLPSPIGEPLLDVPPVPLPSPINVTFPEGSPLPLPVVPLPSPIDVTLPSVEPSTTVVIPVPALTLDASSDVPSSAVGTPVLQISVSAAATLVPVVPVVPVAASVEASAAAGATVLPVIPVAPVETSSVATPATTVAVVPVVPAAPAAPTVRPAAPFIPTLPLPVIPAVPAVPAVVSAVASAVASAVQPAILPGRIPSICRDPTVRQLTLPILNRFYGPFAYPSLFSFPGCLPSNSRQAIQAPGLLNCTALGAEVQTCQQSGRRVLLSVKADGPGAVGGNLDFGSPSNTTVTNTSLPSGGDPTAQSVSFPNLFDSTHVPSAFALTLFSLFGEGRTERADLRPLGPDTPAEDGITWVEKPLGEEVVVDGYDVQVPRDWQGTYQEGQFNALVSRLRELNDQAWTESGAVNGGSGDLGADGKSVVFQGWNRKRSVQRIVMVGGYEVVVE